MKRYMNTALLLSLIHILIGLIKASSRQFHQTVVMITHNEEIAQTADRIIRIEDGKITESRWTQ